MKSINGINKHIFGHFNLVSLTLLLILSTIPQVYGWKQFNIDSDDFSVIRDCSKTANGAFKTVCFLIGDHSDKVMLMIKCSKDCSKERDGLIKEFGFLKTIESKGVRVVGIHKFDDKDEVKQMSIDGKQFVVSFMTKIDSMLSADEGKFCVDSSSSNVLLDLFAKSKIKYGTINKKVMNPPTVFKTVEYSGLLGKGEDKSIRVTALTDLFKLAKMMDIISVRDLQVMMDRNNGKIYVLDPAGITDEGNTCGANLIKILCKEVKFSKYTEKDSEIFNLC